MIKLLLFSIALLMITGCSVKRSHVPGTATSKYAPMNATEKLKVVRVKVGKTGKESTEAEEKEIQAGNSSREDAYKQMYKICKHKYIIVSERIIDYGSVFITNSKGNGGYMVNKTKDYIKFLCQ